MKPKTKYKTEKTDDIQGSISNWAGGLKPKSYDVERWITFQGDKKTDKFRVYFFKDGGALVYDWSDKDRNTVFHTKKQDPSKFKYPISPPEGDFTEKYNQIKGKAKKEQLYLAKKGIDPTGLNIKQKAHSIVIPIYAKGSKKIISIQKIDSYGRKKYEAGYRLSSGHYFPIGKLKDCIYICEGFATGVAIWKITGELTLCAFSKSNLDNTAKWVLEKYPKKDVIMCLDNDGDNTHKPKIKNKRLRCVVPSKEGDFDDFKSDKEEIDKLFNDPKDVIKLIKTFETLGYKLRFNVRSNKVEVKKGNKEWSELTDEERSYIFLKVKDYEGKITKSFFDERLKGLSYKNQIDPFKDYLSGLEWDKKTRLEDFLFKCFKIEGEDNIFLAKWAFKSILLGVVGRTFEPGKQHDEFVILKGPQGVGKGSLLYNLLPDKDLFTNSVSLSSQNKSIVEIIQDKALCEVAELSGFRKAEIEKMKSFITTRRDNCRFAYRKDAQGVPRRCVFVGTTNNVAPLPDDPTGLRRFVVIEAKKKTDMPVDKIIESVQKNREQLWAEAVKCYEFGESARLPEDLFDVSARVAEQNRGGDTVFEDVFLEMINGKSTVILGDVLKEMKDGTGEGKDKKGGGYITSISNALQNKAKEILHSIGYVERRKYFDGIRKRVWENENIAKKQQKDLVKQVYGDEKTQNLDEKMRIVDENPQEEIPF